MVGPAHLLRDRQLRRQAAVGLLKSGKGKRLLISGVNPVADLDDLRRRAALSFA